MSERGWRVVATVLSYLFYGLGSLVLWYAVYPCTAWRVPPDRRQAYARNLCHKGFYLFIRFMELMGVWRYRVVGKERLGPAGRVVVANHPSFLDVVLLLALKDDTACVVKPGLLRVPLVGEAIRRCGHVVADSPEEMVETSRQILQQGASLVLFPQGTRTPPGTPIRFHRSAARIALEAETTLIPVFFDYHPALLGKDQHWYNVPSTRPQVQVNVAEEIQPNRVADEPLSLASRKLTRRLEALFKAWERGHGFSAR